MSNTYTTLLYHVVFSTKEHIPCISGEPGDRLPQYMGGIVREIGGRALAIGATLDHVHMLLSLDATHCLADVLRIVKANSSKWVHEEWPTRRDFGWQEGYAAFTVSESNRDRVAEYVNGQEQHHRRLSAQDELRSLPRKHGVDFDERFL